MTASRELAAETGARAPTLGLALFIACCAGACHAAAPGGSCRVVQVADSAGAQQALKNAHDGATILLAPGDYVFDKVQGLNFAKGVTVASADPAHPAVLEGLYLQEASGITFRDFEVRIDRRQKVGIIVQGGGRVALENLNIHGAGVSDGLGIRLVEVKNVALSNLEIHDVEGGMGIGRSENVAVTNSYIHDLEIDGIQSAGSSHVTITGNTFTDFYPKKGDHSDAIQFVGTPVAAHDIMIANNTYTRGAGLGNTQGVLMGDEGRTPYENVTVTGNAIIGGVYHGISVYAADHLDINHNLVVGYTDVVSWILVNQSTNASVTDNVATAMNPGKDNVGLVSSRNKTIGQPKIGNVAMLAGRSQRAKAGPGATQIQKSAGCER